MREVFVEFGNPFMDVGQDLVPGSHITEEDVETKASPERTD